MIASTQELLAESTRFGARLSWTMRTTRVPMAADIAINQRRMEHLPG